MALVVKNLLASAGDGRDMGLILVLRRSPGERHSNPLQYSCLENPMDREAWQATIHKVAKSWTQLKQLSTEVGCLIINLWEYVSANWPRSCLWYLPPHVNTTSMWNHPTDSMWTLVLGVFNHSVFFWSPPELVNRFQFWYDVNGVFSVNTTLVFGSHEL